MKIKTLILVIAFVLVAYFGFKYLSKKDKKLTEEKKYIQEQEGTRKWLLGQFPQLLKYSANTTKKLQIGENATPYFSSSVISKIEAEQKGVDWARNIIIDAIQKKISYKQAVDNNLKYLMIEKWGYDLNEDF